MSSCGRTLYVGGFGAAFTAAELRELFARHGAVQEVRLADRGDASFAHVTFEHPDHADAARRELDGSHLAGRRLRVAFAQ